MLSSELKKLFKVLYNYSDDYKIMFNFVEAVKFWIKQWNKGDVRMCLISLNDIDHHFPSEDLFIAYDDMTGNDEKIIYTTTEFIDFFIQNLNENTNELMPDAYWIKNLNGILEI